MNSRRAFPLPRQVALLRRLFSLQRNVVVWVKREELGSSKLVSIGRDKVTFKVPEKMEKIHVQKFPRGGFAFGPWRGDLVLTYLLNEGMNELADYWVSMEELRDKGEFEFVRKRETIKFRVPRNVANGSVLRLRGKGVAASVPPGAPTVALERGDLILTLRTFPASIKPYIRQVDAMDTEHLAVEGWVYNMIDRLTPVLKGHLPKRDLTASMVAAAFNEGGWYQIANGLRDYMGLGRFSIQFKASPDLSNPGNCQTNSVQNSHGTIFKHLITINTRYIHDPFQVVAVLAHELCHVVHIELVLDSQEFVKWANQKDKPAAHIMEMEKTVDLLVFLYKLGEFQIRVAQSLGQTLGYYNQINFNRIYRIINGRKN